MNVRNQNYSRGTFIGAGRGAELNCIDLGFAREMNVQFVPTDAGALAAGENQIDIAGVTSEDFIISSDYVSLIYQIFIRSTSKFSHATSMEKELLLRGHFYFIIHQ